MAAWTRSFGIGLALAVAACAGREVRLVAPVAKAVEPEPSASASASAAPQPPAPTQEQLDRAAFEAILARRGEGTAVVREALLAFLASVPHYALRSPAYAALGDLALDEYRGDAAHLALAEAYFKQALWDSSEASAHATYRLAHIDELRGDHDAAIAAYRRTCELDWRGSSADAARSSLPAVFAIEHTPEKRIRSSRSSRATRATR